MSDAALRLLPTLLELTEEDREYLARVLLDSIDGDRDGDSELLPTLQRRLDDISTGRVEPLSVEDMMKRLRDKHR